MHCEYEKDLSLIGHTVNLPWPISGEITFTYVCIELFLKGLTCKFPNKRIPIVGRFLAFLKKLFKNERIQLIFWPLEKAGLLLFHNIKVNICVTIRPILLFISSIRSTCTTSQGPSRPPSRPVTLWQRWWWWPVWPDAGIIRWKVAQIFTNDA